MRKAGMTVFLTAMALGVTVALAQQPDGGARDRAGMREGGFGGVMMRDRGGAEAMLLDRLVNDPELAKTLMITAEQVEALKKVRTETRNEQITLNAELERAALKQADLMAAQPVDEEAVFKAVEEAGAIRTKLAKLQVQQVIAMKKSLTPEQQEKAKTVFRERMERRMQEMRRGGDERGQRGGRRGADGPPAQPMAPPMAPPPAN